MRYEEYIRGLKDRERKPDFDALYLRIEEKTDRPVTAAVPVMRFAAAGVAVLFIALAVFFNMPKGAGSGDVIAFLDNGDAYSQYPVTDFLFSE